MLVELNENEIKTIRDVLGSINEAETQLEYKVGDVLVMRKSTSYGVSSRIVVVDAVDEKKGQYTLSYPNMETKLEYEPSIGIQYAFSRGFSYPTVLYKRVVTGFDDTKRNPFVMKKQPGENRTAYELNKDTGRFREMKGIKFKLYNEGDEIVVDSGEIDDQKRVKELFDQHPDWEKEEVKSYDMTK